MKNDIDHTIYSTPQQVGATCFLFPFIMTAREYDKYVSRYFSLPWKTKLEWFAATYPAVRDWHVAMGRLLSKQDGIFSKLFQDMLTNGVKLEENIIAQELGRLEESEDLYTQFTPHTAEETAAYSMQTVSAPIFLENNEKFYLYKWDVVNSKIIKEELRTIKDETFCNLVNVIDPIANKNYDLYLSTEQAHYLCIENLQAANIFYKNKFGQGNTLEFRYMKCNSIMPYMEGTYWLMLFAMGYDRNLNKIDKEHPLYAALIEFSEEMRKSQLNPWNPDNSAFTAENLLEFRLARLLKQRTDLQLSLANSLKNNIFCSWPYYKKLQEQLGNADPKLQYLPGEEVMLAFSLSQYIHLLSHAAISYNALREVAEATAETIPDQLIENFIYASRQNPEFFKIWADIKELLGGPGTTCLSFYGHGSVVRLDSKFCRIQEEKFLASDIFKTLSVSYLDSLFNKQSNPVNVTSRELYNSTVNKAMPSIIKIQALWRGALVRNQHKKSLK